MRPSAFANGNCVADAEFPLKSASFNEAVGFRQRKYWKGYKISVEPGASMRPSAFANGNDTATGLPITPNGGFNEAVGFRQRKCGSRDTRCLPMRLACFNEAVGFRQRK